MDARKLQSLRNLGNECEEAAEEIDRLTRELAEWKADQSYLIACQTIRTLREDLAEAKARALPDGWVAVPVEPITGENYENGLWSRRNWTAALEDMLSARPELPPNGFPKQECPTCYADGVYDTDGNGPMDCYTCGKKAARKEPSNVD